MRSRNYSTLVVSACAVLLTIAPASAQTASIERPERSASIATFRSSVNLVSIAAVVRDKRGRVMSTLSGQDFVVMDGGERRELLDFQSTVSAPASVALLIDGSGSMRLGAAHEMARRISRDVIATLDSSRDTVALFSFDTRLITLCRFTSDFELVRASLWDVDAFGSTSLYDAVAGTSALVADKAQSRRAVIVVTDGDDTTSTYSAEKVAWIASSIDVPVYVFAVGDGSGLTDERGAPKTGTLTELARATGGDLFIANTPERIATAVKRVTEELRHQYVLAFESAPDSGVRRLEVRTRQPELRVKSRNWYQAASEE